MHFRQTIVNSVFVIEENYILNISIEQNVFNQGDFYNKKTIVAYSLGNDVFDLNLEYY